MKCNAMVPSIGLLFFLASCSGGGSSGSSSPAGGGGGGVAGPAASAGAITAKGSIFVNGIEFETQGAELEMEDDQGNDVISTIGLDDSMLRVGMGVEVEGRENGDDRTGQAQRIRVRDTVEGPIASLDVSSATVKRLVVLGQTVVVEDGVTAFDNTDPALSSFAGLDAADVGVMVEVHGPRRADGSVAATYIESSPPGASLEVRGEVSALGATTFQIEALLVDYSGAVVDGVLADGLLVEVKGLEVDPASGALFALSVEVGPGGFDDVPKARVEGYITSLSGNLLVVEGQQVDISGAIFRGGVQADLALGTKVEVEGPIVGGVLQAIKVEFEDSIRIEANVDQVGASSLSFQNLPGISIEFDGTLSEGSLAAVSPGMSVKVRARPSGSSGSLLLATRLEIQSQTPADRMFLQGPVESFDAASGSISILGIAIDTSSISENSFEDEDLPIGRAAFFAGLSTGRIVKARFDLVQGVWDEIEYEDD